MRLTKNDKFCSKRSIFSESYEPLHNYDLCCQQTVQTEKDKTLGNHLSSVRSILEFDHYIHHKSDFIRTVYIKTAKAPWSPRKNKQIPLLS